MLPDLTGELTGAPGEAIVIEHHDYIRRLDYRVDAPGRGAVAHPADDRSLASWDGARPPLVDEVTERPHGKELLRVERRDAPCLVPSGVVCGEETVNRRLRGPTASGVPCFEAASLRVRRGRNPLRFDWR